MDWVGDHDFPLLPQGIVAWKWRRGKRKVWILFGLKKANSWSAGGGFSDLCEIVLWAGLALGMELPMALRGVLAICVMGVSVGGRVAEGGTFTQVDFQPMAVTADGSTVFCSSGAPGFAKWTATGGVQLLAPNAAGATPFAVSPDGSVVVGVQGKVNEGQAVMWTAAGGYQLIGPNNPGVISQAFSVSADGTTILGSARAATLPTSGFIWTAGRGTVLLPDSIEANEGVLSADGSTVLARPMLNDTFVWTKAGGEQPLTAPGVNYFGADVISADGSKAFGAARSTSGWFVYEYDNGTMTSLGYPTMFGEPTQVYVAGANADDSLLVGYNLFITPAGFGSWDPWVWTRSDGYESLNDWLRENGVDVGNQQLGIVTGISANGQTVFGYGDGWCNGKLDSGGAGAFGVGGWVRGGCGAGSGEEAPRIASAFDGGPTVELHTGGGFVKRRWVGGKRY